MRSKEVEEGIYRLQRAIDYDKEHRLVTIYDEKPLTRDLYQAVLNYISELEENQKQTEKIDDGYVNRGKVIEKINERIINIMEKDGELKCCDVNLMVEYNTLINEILWELGE